MDFIIAMILTCLFGKWAIYVGYSILWLIIAFLSYVFIFVLFGKALAIGFVILFGLLFALFLSEISKDIQNNGKL